jgi:SAM-dependent methyltransferase
VHPIYDDFTTPTFDERHNLIKGGSWISCGNEARHAARYAFRRHFFQHAGFRYVVGEPLAARPLSQLRNRPPAFRIRRVPLRRRILRRAQFSARLAELAIAAMAERPAHKALDLGCATGRASFELARHFDRSPASISPPASSESVCNSRRKAVLRYTLTDEGELVSYRERRLADLGLEAVRDKVDFFQGDACNLKAIHAGLRPDPGRQPDRPPAQPAQVARNHPYQEGPADCW